MLELNKEYIDERGRKCSVIALSRTPAAMVEFENGERLMVPSGSFYEQAMKKAEPTIMLDIGDDGLQMQVTQKNCIAAFNQVYDYSEKTLSQRGKDRLDIACAIIHDWINLKFKDQP